MNSLKQNALKILLLVNVVIWGAHLYQQKVYAEHSRDRAERALADERLSRYLECGDRPICADRWPEAAKRVAEAKEKVQAETRYKAIKSHFE